MKKALIILAFIGFSTSVFAQELESIDYLRLSLQKLKEARLLAKKSKEAGGVRGFNYRLYLGYLDRTIENLERAIRREEREYDRYYHIRIDSDLLMKDLGEKR